MAAGIENATTVGSILPMAEGGTFGMLNYAQMDPACVHAVFNNFMIYLPFVLLLQSVSEC